MRARQRLPTTGPAVAVDDDLAGELTLHGRVMPASNATFVGEIDGVRVVYKPVAGERPLWDFPDGTLAGRELAAYLTSEALGWNVVPRTILRDGPHGPGMVQVWQEPDPEQVCVDLVPAGSTPERFRHVFDGIDAHDREVSLIHEDNAVLRLMAVFDVLVNNADRKGGHVLPMADGHRYGVDHGLTFHVEHKLRTVLWGWMGEPLTDEESEGIRRVLAALDGDLRSRLASHVKEGEIDALRRRCRSLLDHGRLPAPRDESPVIPWPPF